MTITIELSVEGIRRVRVPVTSIADHVASRELLNRLMVPLDLLHRAAQNFPSDDVEPVPTPLVEAGGER